MKRCLYEKSGELMTGLSVLDLVDKTKLPNGQSAIKVAAPQKANDILNEKGESREVGQMANNRFKKQAILEGKFTTKKFIG